MTRERLIVKPYVLLFLGYGSALCVCVPDSVCVVVLCKVHLRTFLEWEAHACANAPFV